MNSRHWMMIVAALALIATGVRADEADLKKTFEELLPGMGQEQAQQKWQEVCWKAGAPGHEAERGQACKLMAEKLGAGTPAPTRVWLLKQLERIGRGECVEKVAAVVSDSDRLVRDAAIRALANNPEPAAGDKLRAAYKASGDDGLRAAIANALGFRGEPASVDVLARGDYRDVKDPAVVVAKARALGKIATPAAITALKSALEQTRGPVRLQVGDALAKCGEKLSSEGRTAEARAIAELLYQPDQPARLAGPEGLLRTSGDDVAGTILQVLARGDALDTSAAVGFVAGVDSKGIKQLADGLTTLPPAAQVALLQGLGARRDRAALPAVTTAASSDNQVIKTAALAALGGVGDRSTVPLLVQAIENGGQPAGTARQSLETVFADGVDQALVDIMKRTEDRGRRALFIEILDQRRAAAAVPALLQEVAGDDGNVRRRAISALGNVAGPEDIAGLIRGLLKIHDAGERDEAGRAVAVCVRVADESRQAEPVLAEYRGASPAEQLVLLPVLGQIGGTKALGLIRDAVASPDPERRASGQQALFHWPDSTVADDLANLAEKAQDNDLKIRAIQALARVVVLPGDRTEDARLALLARAMKQASRNEDRRMILDRVRAIHTFPAVRFAAGFLDDPKLASQACATIADLLHHHEIRDPNQAESNKVLDQVIAISKDKSLVERARSFKSVK
jgi:HEAT repeat protein